MEIVAIRKIPCQRPSKWRPAVARKPEAFRKAKAKRSAMETNRAYLECLEPDGKTVKYRTETVLASPDLQKQCTQRRALKRILASMAADQEKDASEKRPQTRAATTRGLISKIGLLVLPSLAVFGIRPMISGRGTKHD